MLNVGHGQAVNDFDMEIFVLIKTVFTPAIFKVLIIMAVFLSMQGQFCRQVNDSDSVFLNQNDSYFITL